MIEYEKLTNEELSQKVMESLYGEEINHWSLSVCGTFIYDCGILGEDFYKIPLLSVDSPADMFNLMKDFSIDIEWPEPDLGNVGTVHKYLKGAMDIQEDFYDKEEGLRTIAIVFLRMKEKQNG
tara:strand:- start:39 stop:407 length:369 start_codon:yes stop_codon:yes gene_type:complete